MNRRELLKMIAIATGATVVGGEFLLTGCKNPNSGTSITFSEDDILFLDEVAETILPQTTTPGARAAGVGQFIAVMARDCYTKEEQETFYKGISDLNDICRKIHGQDFLKVTPEQRKVLLTNLDNDTKQMGSHYFQQMKQLTIFGYFTSEIGKKEGQRYVPVPGRWDAVIDYKKGEKSFVGLGQ